jgi:hypothetical protein
MRTGTGETQIVRDKNVQKKKKRQKLNKWRRFVQ